MKNFDVLKWFAKFIMPGVPRCEWPRYTDAIIWAIHNAVKTPISGADARTMANAVANRLHELDWEQLEAAYKITRGKEREEALQSVMANIPTFRITAYRMGNLSSPTKR